jgi:PKD repeat protein
MKYNTNELRRICYTLAVNLPPVALATQSVQYGPGPLTVNFVGSGSSDPENGALTYLWNFGDGGPTSTQADPTRVFNAPPGVPTSYTVTLTVTDNIGQSASTQLLVSVNNTPPAVNISSIPVPAFYPLGVDTTFQLQADVTDTEHGPAQLTYAWRTTLHHNTHTHPEPFDNNVSSSTVISGVGCDGETFYYVVSLTVTDAGGLSTTVQREIHPRCYAIAPTAIILANASFGEGPLAVTFDGTQSYDPGQITAFHWDFGDGTTSNSPTPSKSFTDTGDHLVTLTVTDNDGLTGTAVKTIAVLDHMPPQCPGPAGSLLREFWSGISGSSVGDLINTPNYPNNPSGSSNITQFQGPTNFTNNYGTRVRGWIVAPQTGNYTFTLTSDDASALYLSPNAEPQYMQAICNVPGWTNETEYTKYATQTSASIPMVAGRYYYVELLHKEGSGGDHFAVRWQTPSNSTRTIVPGSALVRWQNCQPSVKLRVNLQGAYDAATGLMRDDLRALSLVPIAEPYQALAFPQVGAGGETTTVGRLAQTGKNAVVDWVRVELRNKNNPSLVLATRSALLERDGDIVGVDGYTRLIFNVPADDYFIAVRHRNHLGVMSQGSVALGASVAGADFTLGSTAAWGTDARTAFNNGKSGLWCGNVYRDTRLAYTGEFNDRDPILTLIGGSNPNNTVMGYHLADVTMDGMVRYIGAGNDRDPILVNIGGNVPTLVRTEQMP